jgi:hypothetical protein
MNDFLSLSRSTFNAQSYYAGVIGNRLTDSDATKERALRLYAIGELNAAAQLLSELAARRHPYLGEGREESIHG